MNWEKYAWFRLKPHRSMYVRALRCCWLRFSLNGELFGRSLFFSKFIKLPRFFLIPRIKRKTKQKIRRNRREKKKLLLFLPLAVFVLCWLLREQHFLKIWKMKSINRECKKNWRIEKSSNWLQLYTERWRMKSRQKSKNDAQWKCEHYLCGE